MFKEALFDRLGYSDRSWSQQLGRASYDIMYLIAQNLLCTGHSLILESNFKADFDRPRLLQIKRSTPFRSLEILCFAQGEILFERFKQRALSGLRHPGHVDNLCLQEQQAVLSSGVCPPLTIGPVIKVNTTDFEKVRYPQVLTRVKQFISGK